MQKVLNVVGIGLVACSLLFLAAMTMVRTSDTVNLVTTDVLGLAVPEPPEWTSFVPVVGGAVAVVAQMFSMHGVATIGFFLVLMYAGSAMLYFTNGIEDRY